MWGGTKEDREETTKLWVECEWLEGEVDNAQKNTELKNDWAMKMKWAKWEAEWAMWEGREQQPVQQLHGAHVAGVMEPPQPLMESIVVATPLITFVP